jgi:hypothetical protein
VDVRDNTRVYDDDNRNEKSFCMEIRRVVIGEKKVVRKHFTGFRTT